MAHQAALVSASFALSFMPLGSSMFFPVSGSSPVSLPTPELSPAAATVAPPSGTSAEFALMPFVGVSAAAAGDAAAFLKALLETDPGNTAEIIKSLLAPFLTRIQALMLGFSQINALSAANAHIEQEDADFRHQLEQLGTDLTAAQAKLADDQKLLEADPLNKDLAATVATDQTNIAAIQNQIDGSNQSIAENENQSAVNTAQIASLETAALAGLAPIANAIAQRISEELQKAAAHNQTVDVVVQQIYDDLQGFLNDAQVAKVLLQVQQRAAGDADTTRVAAGQATDSQQTRASAQAPSSANNQAVANNVSRTAPDQAAASGLTVSNQIAPAIDAPLPVQIPARVQPPAPTDDPGDQDNEQADLDQIRIRAENVVEPVPTGQVSPELRPERQLRSPVPDINANVNAAVQERITANTVERNDRISNTEARTTNSRTPQDVLLADVIKKADELTANLDRLLQRFVKPSTTTSLSAPSGNSLAVASLQETPGRLKIPV